MVTSPTPAERSANLLTDLATRRVYPIFTKDRSAPELCKRMTSFYISHSEWKNAGSEICWFVRVDPERKYESDAFLAVLSLFGYCREPTTARDKHANGVAEHTVGSVS